MELPDSLVAYVSAINPLSLETWAEISALFRTVELDRGEHLVPPGRPATQVGLLERGWVRAYHINANGTEYSKHLFRAPAMVGDYASLLTGESVRTPQQTLTPVTVHVAEWVQVVALFDAHRDLERLARRFAELLYLDNERREIELVTLPASERLRLLIERHPSIERDLPLFQIAAHLGITPTQLSRIRRRQRAST